MKTPENWTPLQCYRRLHDLVSEAIENPDTNPLMFDALGANYLEAVELLARTANEPEAPIGKRLPLSKSELRAVVRALNTFSDLHDCDVYRLEQAMGGPRSEVHALIHAGDKLRKELSRSPFMQALDDISEQADRENRERERSGY